MLSSKQLFNNEWIFLKTSIGTTLEEINTKLDLFEAIDVPHDWLIYNPLDLYETSTGWYYKRFNLNLSPSELYSLCFDGVYMDSTLYINDQKVGEWKYGYSSFEFDITAYLKEGENTVKVSVNHESPNSRWYSGAGIYRNVWLIKKPLTHIVSDGIYVTPVKEDGVWRIEIETELVCQETIRLQHTLLKEEGLVSCSQLVEAGSTLDCQYLYIENPLLWDLHEPHLYSLKTEMLVNERVTQSEVTTVGFRSVTFEPQRGFLLNGRKIKLSGVCEHHDLGALGAAFNTEAMKRKLTLLKEMGVNALRTSHNMPAREVMTLADEMGILVVSEAFDMWERPKTTYDYARFFKEWYQKDVASWVRRDRNHPSLIMWSIGNEIYDTHHDERGQEVTRMLMEEVLKHDPKAHGKVTIGSNYMPWEHAKKCADLVKMAGYNYGEKYYEAHHEMYPDWVIYGSETSSTVQSRGVYHFPYKVPLLSDDDEQCSSLGNSTTSWGAKSSEACIIAERDHVFSMGQFLWTGFDYIGEPTPYHTKNSYFGQLDTAGFKKDSFYIYQSAWTHYKEKPMVHIFPYWDFNPGQMIDIRVCSNAPRIALYFNETCVGTHEIDHKRGMNLVGHWVMPYEPGKLTALAYDEMGNVIAKDEQCSFKDATQILLVPNKKVMKANGEDLIFIEITMKDEEGHTVHNANNRIHVSVKGAGRLMGLDNGDSTDYETYKGDSRQLFNGKLLAIIGAKVQPGTIEVVVTSEGIVPQTLNLQAEAAPVRSGISAYEENKALNAKNKQCPIRKIELRSSAGQCLTPTQREVTIEAAIYPKQAEAFPLSWSVVDYKGIPSHLAQIVSHGYESVLTAIGSGEFIVRCTTTNGTDKVKLISQLEFKAEGLSKAYLNPYELITGGLYSSFVGDIGNGNEKGVSTARDGESRVTYEDIDFGSYGSDEITMPIFTLSEAPYVLEIWEGIPGEVGSEKVGDFIYQKPSIWNVYQEATYKLSKRLKGITALSFVTYEKMHIKGFSFRVLDKAFEKLYTHECDKVYGDQFVKTNEGILEIGNNVSIVFDELDFGEKGANELVICGKSPIEKNAIHVSFMNEEEERKELLAFTYTQEEKSCSYSIGHIKGKQKVTFVFLPGSRFDFKWFQFK